MFFCAAKDSPLMVGLTSLRVQNRRPVLLLHIHLERGQEVFCANLKGLALIFNLHTKTYSITERNEGNGSNLK